MKHFKSIVLSVAIVLSAGMAEAANAPSAMIVPGQFNVTSTGAATYTIPITAPPGTAGLVPVLSLQYSSSNGDGVEGIGWVLGGLLSIDRCPRTIAQDSTHGSINYDTNDRFCLNGQRLMLINGSSGHSYGDDLSEYRTEIDSFTRVIAHCLAGSCTTANGPSWFEVHTKSGQILQLGNTADSQVLATGTSTPRTWAVNQISDTAGNYLTVRYNSASGSDRMTNGEFYPLEIDYTGNSRAGTGPYNSVKFSYNCVDGVGTCRADSVPTYQAGSVVQLTALLTDIKTYQSSNLVTDYRLSYRAGTTVVHSRLISLTQYDASNNPLPAAITFGWQGGTQAQTPVTTTIPTIPTGNIYLAGDYNGDGLTDFALIPVGISVCPPYSIYLGTASSGFSSSSLTLPNPAAFYPFCGADPPAQTVLTTNGLTAVSILVQGNTGPPGDTTTTFFTLLASGNAINVANYQLGTTYTYSGGSPSAGDFDGNGIPDIFVQTFPNSTFFLGSSSGSFTPNTYTGMPWTNTIVTIGDFDGDGCSDLYAQAISGTTGGTSEVIYSPYCHPAVPTKPLPMPAASNPIVGDFNGDGKTDVIGLDSGGTLRLWLSTGTGFTQVATVPTTPLFVGDFNGDGKADYVDTSGNLYLSTGTGFVQALDGNNNPVVFSTSGILADWNNDGAADLLVPLTSISGVAYVPELMTSISNGIGATTTITYDRLNKNGSLYQKCNSAGVYNCNDVYPTQSLDGPIYVVSRIDSSNGLGACPSNCYSTTYSYAMAKSDLQGRGFLGFAQVNVDDLQTNITETTNYSQTFPYTGLVTSKTRVQGTTILSTITNTLNDNTACGSTASPAGPGVYIVCTTQTVEANNDLSGAQFPTVTTKYTYDNYGNILTNNVSVSDGSSKNTTNTFQNDTTNWFLGRVLTISVTSQVGSSSPPPRQSCYAYDSTTGLLIKEVLQPVSLTTCSPSPAYGLETDYVLDLFGHRTKATVSGNNIATRSSSAVYDSLGQFQIQAINALGQAENWAYDARFGAPTSHAGPNHLTTTWSYDTFGRLTQESRPDGTQTKTSYGYCSSGCPTYGALSVLSEIFASDGATQIGAISTAYFDSLSRPIANDTQGFNGSNVRVATQYDSNERILQASRPYFTASGSPHFTVFSYDPLGRVTQATFPDNSVTKYCFNGQKTAVTDFLNQTTTTNKNAQGLNAGVVQGTGLSTTSACDPMTVTTTTSYVYDAFRNLLTVTDPSSNVITNTYDIRGNKTSSADPDMGTWTYGYDVLGELTNQTDAKSQSTVLTYDILGRVLTRSEATQYSAWTYGTTSGGHNVGQVIDVQTCPTSSCSTIISDRAFTYDNLGRPYRIVLTTGGSQYGYLETYSTTNGKLSNIAYPSGFSVNYTYNIYGYLTNLADTNSNTIWTANARDAELHLTTQTQGNGVQTTQAFDPNTGLIQTQQAGASNAVANFAYSFDTIGNLLSRTDNNESFTEQFCYDSLNRLTNSNIGSACTGGKTASYDVTGNITGKSDIGTYSYPSFGSAQPHAVSSISGAVDGLTNPQYSYDANGNMTCMSTVSGCSGTIGRQLTVTSFNMAATLTEGSTTTSLTYDDQRARITQAVTVSGTTTTTTYLNDPASGALSQKVQVGTAIPTWVDYIQADGQIVAQRSVVYPSGSLWGFNNWLSFNWGSSGSPAVTWAYFSLDHLGSIAVISNSGGTVIQRLSYDPWGKQRNPNGTDVACGTITSPTTRGYTNQEQMPAECLVNLNARIYDPSIGRFMAADSIVPNQFNGQTLNRFSYVTNNPLSFVDPTGQALVQADAPLVQPFETVIVNGTTGGISLIPPPFIPASGDPEIYSTTFGAVAGALNNPSPNQGDRGAWQDWESHQSPAASSVSTLAPGNTNTTLSTQNTAPGAALILNNLGNLPQNNGSGSPFAAAMQLETIVVTADRIRVSFSLYDFSATAGVQLAGGTNGAPSLFPHGGGILIGGNAAAGVGNLGGAANGTAGGFYINPLAPSWDGLFTGGGVAGNAGNLSSGSPAQGDSNQVLGASASGGFSAFLTNATSVDQLAGPFTTQSVDIGLGPFQAGAQLSTGNGIWELSVSPPFAGATFGLSYSKITTQTCTSSGCN